MSKRPPGEFADPAVRAAIDHIAEGIEALRATGLAPADCPDASQMFAEIETLGRRLVACQVDVLADVDTRNLYTQDLAGSAKVLMRHRAKLSAPEASARQNLMRCLRDLPAIQEAYRQGLIAEPNARRLSSTWGNERVRAKLIEAETEMLHKAAKMVHPHFCKYLAGWERLADEDGAQKDDQTTHDKRKANIVQNFDKGFSIEG
ncbi:MAG: DUF222 domain-containing protein, partial [bacterium]|nr:DUF222 domain-containing protein [bacterium]